MDTNKPYPNSSIYQKDNNIADLHPRPITSILIASVFILIEYLLAFVFIAIYSISSPTIQILLIVVPLFLNLLLSVAAAAGLNPNKIKFFSIVLMFFLTCFPMFTWIPFYLAGKAIARKKSKSLVPNPSKIPLLIFGLINVILALLFFSNIFYQ